MKPADIIIRDDFRDLIPPLSKHEREELKDQLQLAFGPRDPLVVWRGENVLLDGHNRFEISRECNWYGQGDDFEFAVVQVDILDEDHAREWIIENQLGRRNLNPKTASKLRGDLYELRRRRHGGDRKSAESRPQNEVLIGNMAAQVAKETGVSRATVERDAEYARACKTLGITDPQADGRSKKEVVEAAKKAKREEQDEDGSADGKAARSANPPKQRNPKKPKWMSVVTSFDRLEYADACLAYDEIHRLMDEKESKELAR